MLKGLLVTTGIVGFIGWMVMMPPDVPQTAQNYIPACDRNMSKNQTLPCTQNLVGALVTHITDHEYVKDFTSNEKCEKYIPTQLRNIKLRTGAVTQYLSDSIHFNYPTYATYISVFCRNGTMLQSEVKIESHNTH